MMADDILDRKVKAEPRRKRLLRTEWFKLRLRETNNTEIKHRFRVVLKEASVFEYYSDLD